MSRPSRCTASATSAVDRLPRLRDADGRLYLFWKNDGNAKKLDTRIWVQPLSPDGRQLEGTPTDTGLKQKEPWHGALIEAPTVVLHDGTYVLFYSANDYASDTYAMGYATATKVTGPYTDRSVGEPWVASEGDAAAPAARRSSSWTASSG
jgi:beta-xylosidase